MNLSPSQAWTSYHVLCDGEFKPNLKLSHPLATNSLQCVANPLNRRGDLSVEPWVNVTASFVLAPLYAHCIKFCILQICFHLAIALSLSSESTFKSSSSVTCRRISEVLNNLQRKPERPGVVARCASKQFCLFLLFYFLLFLFHFHYQPAWLRDSLAENQVRKGKVIISLPLAQRCCTIL